MHDPNEDPRGFLLDLFNTAVDAASPHTALAEHLPADTQRRAVVIGAGKAAASMATALEADWQGDLSGLVVTRYEHGEPCERIEVVEASHPVPDDEGEKVARRTLELVSNLAADDLVICLISGGGSSLLSLPASGITLADKQQVNHQLLKSGAAIDEMNCVRKHLSAIKGGQLARACAPASVITLAISDVPGDDPSVIASGPTVPDATTSADALAILERHNIDVSDAVRSWLHSPDSETVKPGDPVFAHCEFQLIATPAQSLQAARKAAEAAGLHVIYLGDDIEGEAREVAQDHATLALSVAQGAAPTPCLVLSGGETTVTVRGNGRGGRNAEYLLALANALEGTPGVYALAADTDGIDGSEDNAGALLDPSSWERARALGLSPASLLDNNNGYGFFSALGDLVVTGPTRTNVNDFRAILVLP